MEAKKLIEEALEAKAEEASEAEAKETKHEEPDGSPTSHQEGVEEIDTASKPAAFPAKNAAKPVLALQREEPPPNPLLLDPYEWERCTITVGYSLLPDQTVSVSVHNHKDEPIVKTFPANDVPLPENILGVMTRLQTIWPTSPVNVTVVLLPKQDEESERPIIASVRVASDTPIVQEGVESNLPFPARILVMLEELKTLIPERGLKHIEKNAKAKAPIVVRPVAKTAASAVAPTNKNIHKDQLTLF